MDFDKENNTGKLCGNTSPNKTWPIGAYTTTLIETCRDTRERPASISLHNAYAPHSTKIELKIHKL